VSIEEIGVDAPSLQSRLRWAEYEVTAEAGLANVAAAIAGLVSAASVPAELHRANKVKMYDLRPLVISLRARAGEKERTIITMRLRAAPEMTGRADQVLAALGLSPAERIHRTRLVLEEVPDVIIAYRTRGWAEESGS
jgi:hypothetical protein